MDHRAPFLVFTSSSVSGFASRIDSSYKCAFINREMAINRKLALIGFRRLCHLEDEIVGRLRLLLAHFEVSNDRGDISRWHYYYTIDDLDLIPLIKTTCHLNCRTLATEATSH